MNTIVCTKNSFGAVDLFVDRKRVLPDRSQSVWNHSPDGFNIGYAGSGASQLALGILLAVTNDEEISVMLHNRFKFAFLANPEYFNQERVELKIDVMAWITQQ